MTHERDIDRLLDLWLIDGPTQVADRVLLDVADRIDRQPQRPAWRFLRRPTPMTSSVRWAAVLVAVALIAVVGFAVVGRPSDSGIGTQPTPTPAVSPSPASSTGSQVPDSLTRVWVSETRPVPGFTGDQDRSWLDLRAPIAEYDISGSDKILYSRVSPTASDRLMLTSTVASVGCAPGDAATYRWSLSPGGTFLTLSTDGADPCAARAAAFPGTWTRFDPLGDLEAATYRPSQFKPFGPPSAVTGRLDYGQMSYTVPAGWSNTNDSPDFLDLRPQGTECCDPPAIYLNSVAVVALADEACTEAPDPAVVRTPDAIADALSRRPGLVVSDRQPVSIGGYQGVRLDLAQAPGWTKSCPFSNGQPTVPLFTDTDPGLDYHWLIGQAERMRVYLVDLGEGRLLLADVDGATDAEFQAMLPEATAIVESVQFRSPAP